MKGDKFKTLYNDLWYVVESELEGIALSVDINYGDMEWGLENTYTALSNLRLIRFAPTLLFPTNQIK